MCREMRCDCGLKRTEEKTLASSISCSEVVGFYIGIKVFHLVTLDQSDTLTFKVKMLRDKQ